LKPLTVNFENKKIVNDLNSKLSSLTKLKPILGSSLSDWKITTIIFIEQNILQVYYNDGHIGGSALLNFSYAKDGNIQWKLIKQKNE